MFYAQTLPNPSEPSQTFLNMFNRTLSKMFDNIQYNVSCIYDDKYEYDNKYQSKHKYQSQ